MSILLLAFCVSALFAIALGRASASGDAMPQAHHLETGDLRARTFAASHQSYAGLSGSRPLAASEPSTTGPQPGAGARRATDASLTVRRPRMRLRTPGPGVSA
jgi:hypothetical protein